MFIRSGIISDFGLRVTLKKSVMTYLRRLYGSFRGYRKGKNIYAFSEFKLIWRRRRDFFLTMRAFIDQNPMIFFDILSGFSSGLLYIPIS